MEHDRARRGTYPCRITENARARRGTYPLRSMKHEAPGGHLSSNRFESAGACEVVTGAELCESPQQR
jgi:hypothetical protein